MMKKYGVEHALQNKELSKRQMESLKTTLLNKYGVDNSGLIPGVIEKRNNTMFERYGTINAQEISWVKEKTKNTLLKLYGVTSVRNIPGVEEKIRITKENLGLQRPHNLISELEKYRNSCVVLKNKQRKSLFDFWDGYDFYDGEYIKDNMNLNHNNPNYPTIDHKFSVLYGFLNNISIAEISKRENFCITKKSLNSRKNKYLELEFKKQLIN